MESREAGSGKLGNWETPEHVKPLPLQDAPEVVENLHVVCQEVLVELVERRLTERRPAEIAHNAAATLQAICEERVQFGSIDKLKHDPLAGQ